MKKWYAVLFIFFAAFLVFRFALSPQRGPAMPPMPPGNPVGVSLGRGALVVEGDAADPLKEVRLFRFSEAGVVEKTPMKLEDPLVTPNRVLFFFAVEPGRRYLAETITRHRTSQDDLLAKPNPPPVEALRIPLESSGAAFTPARIAFAADGRSVFVIADAGAVHEYRISDGTEKIPAGTPPPPAESATPLSASSPDGNLIALVQKKKDANGAERTELVVMH